MPQERFKLDAVMRLVLREEPADRLQDREKQSVASKALHDSRTGELRPTA